MKKEYFNKIIDTLETRYVKAAMREVIRPVELCNTIEQKNILLKPVQGNFFATKKYVAVPPDSFFLFPRNKSICFRHGSEPKVQLGEDGFTSVEHRSQYLRDLDLNEPVRDEADIFTLIGFNTLIHGAIPLFPTMDLPPIMIGPDTDMSDILHRILREEENSLPGKEKMIHRLTDQLVICLCRKIFDNPALAPHVEKLIYLLDKRLINIIQYIQENLDKDLSNNIIASISHVSKDYVGQFFKSLTDHNLQDYIENRRLEHAHFLLRTTSDNIQEIAHKVGFKDPAYFSRRFKIRFNQNAKEVRRTDLLIF